MNATPAPDSPPSPYERAVCGTPVPYLPGGVRPPADGSGQGVRTAARGHCRPARSARPAGPPRPEDGGPGGGGREPAALLGTGEQPARPRRRHPSRPPSGQRRDPARPGPPLVPLRLAPLRPPPPRRRPRPGAGRRRGDGGGPLRTADGRRRTGRGHEPPGDRPTRGGSGSRRDPDPRNADNPAGESADLVGRVADSVRRTAVFITDRRAHPADTADLFLAAEQALLLGHPLHPTPKGRDGLSEAEGRLYSPELRGSFPLHWMAVAPSVLASDSAWTERGRPVTAEQLTARLAGPGLAAPRRVRRRTRRCTPGRCAKSGTAPETAALLDAGLLQDLGPQGAPWHPTSSVRTVYRSGAPAMLKLSLGLRITNSRRENLRKELHRGVEVHRLLRGGLFEQWQAVHPGFDIVRDPSWLAVDGPDGKPAARARRDDPPQPVRADGRRRLRRGLVSPRPYVRPGRTTRQRRPRDAVPARRGRHRARRPHRPPAARRRRRVVPALPRTGRTPRCSGWTARRASPWRRTSRTPCSCWTRDGWPVGGRYRDNQGYYFRESRRANLDAGCPVSAPQRHLRPRRGDRRTLRLLPRHQQRARSHRGVRLPTPRRRTRPARRLPPLPRRGHRPGSRRCPPSCSTHPSLRCKANLLTRLHGLDELVGPVDTQSVYVTITNPLHS